MEAFKLKILNHINQNVNDLRVIVACVFWQGKLSVAEFDRRKHHHVIEDLYCHVCQTRV